MSDAGIGKAVLGIGFRVARHSSAIGSKGARWPLNATSSVILFGLLLHASYQEQFRYDLFTGIGIGSSIWSNRC
jgi:hypothetical protein